MAHISSEILGLRNWFLKYCIIKKLHDKITTDDTLLLGLCKKHWVKYRFGSSSLASLVVTGKFCLLTNKQVFVWVVSRHSDVPFFQGIVQVTVPLSKFRNCSFFRSFFPGTVTFHVPFSVPFHQMQNQPLDQGSGTFLAERANFWLREPYY